MSATDQQILAALRDSYVRIATGDASEIAAGLRKIKYPSLDALQNAITKLEKKIARSSGNGIFQPVTRIPY